MGYGDSNRASRGYQVDVLCQKAFQGDGVSCVKGYTTIILILVGGEGSEVVQPFFLFSGPLKRLGEERLKQRNLYSTGNRPWGESGTRTVVQRQTINPSEEGGSSDTEKSRNPNP